MQGWIVIDRIDNGIAACEIDGREMRMIPLALLPGGVEPGDCLRMEGRGYVLDRGETQRRRSYNAEMLRRLMRWKEEDGEEDSEQDSEEEREEEREGEDHGE